MKTIMIALAALTAVSCFGVEYRQLTQEETELLQRGPKGMTKEELAKRRTALELRHLHNHGGRMIMPGTPKGCIRIVNLQKKVATKDLVAMKESFMMFEPFDIKIVEADCPADIKIKIVDDANLPSLAIYPDDGLATVNVAKLADAKTAAKPAFLAARVSKEALRAFAHMTAGSTYNTALFNGIRNVSELDDCAVDGFSMDVYMRAMNYLRAKGVTPKEPSTYKSVLEAGFEIPPTNEFQRVIYKQVKDARKNGSAK